MNEIDTHLSSYATQADDAIELRLGADLTHLPIIRSMAGNVATRADFDMDTIADLRLAVDEACSALIRAAREEGTLVCRFAVADEVLHFSGAVPSAVAEPPSSGSFGWQVLTTLTDSTKSWINSDTDGAIPWLHVELTKANPVSSNPVSSG